MFNIRYFINIYYFYCVYRIIKVLIKLLPSMWNKNIKSICTSSRLVSLIENNTKVENVISERAYYYRLYLIK